MNFLKRIFSEDQLSFPAPPYTTLREGDNKNFPKRGNRVKIHYQGMLSNGVEFESSHNLRKGYLEFALGEGKVIKCWDRLIKDISIGQFVKVKCSPELAYGNEGMPPKIPRSETLTFYIKLVGYSE